MYRLEGNDRDERSKLSRKEKKSYCLAIAFEIVVKFCFQEKYCIALVAQSLDSNEIDRYFFEILVCVGNIFIIFVKCSVKAFGLIFY